MARYTGEPDFYNNNMFGVASTNVGNNFNNQVAEAINYNKLPQALETYEGDYPFGFSKSSNYGGNTYTGTTKGDFFDALQKGTFGMQTQPIFDKNVDALFEGVAGDEIGTGWTDDAKPTFIRQGTGFDERGYIDVPRKDLKNWQSPEGFWRDDEASLKNLLDNRYVDSAMFATDANIVDDVNENETWTLPQRDWGPVRPTEALPPRGRLDRFLQRFGVPAMTQVTAADKLANKQFMQEQGIGRDPQTGRMIGGDFAGKNAPGTSAWGSANFGEMAQKWDEEYGDMDYATTKMIAKQKRMKAQAAAYAQKLEADRQERIRNERAAASAANQRTQRDPTGGGASGRHMGGIRQDQAQAVAKANEAAGMGGWGLAHGGRVGYKTGGRVGILAAF
jgi:hypothetical protein